MSDLFGTIATGDFSIGIYLICSAVALLCGAVIAFAASFKQRITKSFLIAIILLPFAVETVLLMVNGNVGTGIAIAGAFALVRFRSAAGKARDIAVIFSAMAIGLIAAAGYIGLAFLFAIIVSIVLIALNFVPLKGEKEQLLRIVIPESLDFEGVFDSILDKYTISHRLVETKTTNMGSLYKLKYRIITKPQISMKKLMDELRVKNGNLEISVSEALEQAEEL